MLCASCLARIEDRSGGAPLSQRCPTCRSPLPRVAKAYARGAAAVRAAAAVPAGPQRARALEAALVALRVVVDNMPEHFDARHDLGIVLLRLGRAATERKFLLVLGHPSQEAVAATRGRG